KRSFRNVADQDYIAARLCYRAGLMVQFVWMAQQASERRRRMVRIPNHANAINPTHTVHPDKFHLLEQYVDFPGYVREHFKHRKDKTGRAD
ncbi:MAG: hypothetical protein L0170_11155, partial [Acidobacteria bacterium]|nr:hypothetical protein [Acidobacteriota bacterium]